MLIAQITDTHVVERDCLCYGRISTNNLLKSAIERLNSIGTPPDLVLITGDLTDDGRVEQYEELRSILSYLLSEYWLVLGNHDNRDAFLKVFPHYKFTTNWCAPFIQYVIDKYPIRIIALDTTSSESRRGELCKQRLGWLDDMLRLDATRPTVICMHHPPFLTGITRLDQSMLSGASDFWDIISSAPNVKQVLCGHVHRAIQFCKNSIIASIAPSTSYQIELNLDQSRDSPIMLTYEPAAIQLHHWIPGQGMVSHLMYVDGNYERFDPGF